MDFNDYVKHILVEDAGAARLVGDWFWKPMTFPASGVALTVRSACFWDYQFCNCRETRQFLLERSQGHWCDKDLTQSEVDWIMYTENNQTSLLMRDPYPVSGGPAEWFIRAGNFLTLAELFYQGRNDLSCFHLYKIWLTLPVWIHKREPSRLL
jgi:hypothetical protein